MTNHQYLDMLRTALQQARIAEALYVGRNAVENLAAKAGGYALWAEIDNARAAVVVFDDHAHLSICGSNDELDWWDNFSAHLVSHAGYMVHRGFAQASQRLMSQFYKRKIFSLASALPVIIGGHSAGGAIAELLSMELRVRETITFGAPRAFSPDSATRYASLPGETRRFVMPGDPVPHFPLRKFRCLFSKAQYAHAYAPMYLSESGEVLMEQQTGTVRRLYHAADLLVAASVAQVAKWAGKLPAVMGSNHSVSRYRAAIGNAVERAST